MVAPALQACFVEYGGNRHGFLAFSEIHPDYYQIPVADRQRLIEMEAEEARREEEEADREMEGLGRAACRRRHEIGGGGGRRRLGDETASTAEMLRDAEPDPPPWEASAPSPGAAPVETGDESSATAEMLRDAEPEPPPPWKPPHPRGSDATGGDRR